MAPTNDADPGEPALRRRRLLRAVAAVLLAACAALLAATAEASPTDRRIAGLWRVREVFAVLGGAWLAVLLLAAAASRAWLRRVLGLTIAAVVSLAMLEGFALSGALDFARLLGNAPGEALGSRPVPNADVSGVTWQDTASAWGLPSEPVPFRFRADRRGYRNDADRESGDVYLLGDSCLVAGLVPFEETVSGRLESSTGRAVVNVALIGVGVQRELEMLRESRLPLEGRVVLHFVCESNDQADSATYRGAGSRGPARSSLLHSTFTHNAILALQRLLQPVHPIAPRRSGWIGEQSYTFYWSAQSFRDHEDEIEPILATLGEARRHVESAGGRYAVVVIPEKIRVLGPLCRWPPESELADFAAHCSPLPAAVRQWAAREGVPALDLTDALVGAAKGGRIPWFPADTHWNSDGHLAAAGEISAWLARLGWVPPR